MVLGSQLCQDLWDRHARLSNLFHRTIQSSVLLSQTSGTRRVEFQVSDTKTTGIDPGTLGSLTQSFLPRQATPLGYTLSHWSQFDPETLRKKRLTIFFYNTVQPQYQLGNQEQQLNPNALIQLHLFCKWVGKQAEVPYIQAFFYLRSQKDLCQACKLDMEFPTAPLPTLLLCQCL